MRALRLFAAPIVALIVFLAVPAPASAQFTIGFTIGQPPPPIPNYNVVPAPQQNYLWQPGYWAWGPGGYYWVPGTWVQPPQTGLLWTPGYWGYNGSAYAWNSGYWANQVGFYGGINYGPAYPGTGFYGGQWTPGGFSYNTAAWPVNTTVIHNTYVNRTVINRTVINRTSYNGGRGGIQMHPDAQQERVMHVQHYAATPVQVEHAREASRDRNTYSHVNSGKPDMTSAKKPLSKENPAPHNPVTDSDKAAAQAQIHHEPAQTQHKPPAQSEHNPPAQHPNNNDKKPPV